MCENAAMLGFGSNLEKESRSVFANSMAVSELWGEQ